MRLKRYIPEGQYWQNISDIRQTGFARVFLKGIEAKRNEIRDQNESRPMICDDDIIKDFRFKAGAIWALNWVLNIPEEAKKIIDRTPDDFTT